LANDDMITNGVCYALALEKVVFCIKESLFPHFAHNSLSAAVFLSSNINNICM